MTDIPGTGKLNSEKTTPKNEELGPDESSLTTVNVKQIKKEKTYKPKPEDKLWYNQLRFWAVFGGAGSVFFCNTFHIPQAVSMAYPARSYNRSFGVVYQKIFWEI